MGRGGPLWDKFRNTLYIYLNLLISLFVFSDNYLLVYIFDILIDIFTDIPMTLFDHFLNIYIYI